MSANATQHTMAIFTSGIIVRAAPQEMNSHPQWAFAFGCGVFSFCALRILSNVAQFGTPVVTQRCVGILGIFGEPAMAKRFEITEHGNDEAKAISVGWVKARKKK